MDIRGAGRAVPESVRERMGSGGPRGLQILRSGVKSVRGGFDSHAFPPVRLRVAWLVALMSAALAPGAGPGTAAAVTAAGDSAAARAPAVTAAGDSAARALPAARDSGAVTPAGTAAPRAFAADSSARGLGLVRGTAAAPDTLRLRLHRGRFDEPRWVMLRSLVFPGWGQLHNGSWLKATVLGGGEVWLIGGLIQDNRRVQQLKADVDRARAEADNDAYNRAVNAYNDRLNRFVSREWLLGGLMVYTLMDAYVDAHFRDFKVEFERDPALPGGLPPARQTRLSVRWTF